MKKNIYKIYGSANNLNIKITKEYQSFNNLNTCKNFELDIDDQNK